MHKGAILTLISSKCERYCRFNIVPQALISISQLKMTRLEVQNIGSDTLLNLAHTKL